MVRRPMIVAGCVQAALVAVLLFATVRGASATVTRYDDGDASATYTGDWTPVGNGSAYGGGWRQSDVGAAQVSFTFTVASGTTATFTLLGIQHESGVVNAEWRVDGAVMGYFDELGSLAFTTPEFTTGTLAAGSHTVVVARAGAGYLYIDGYDLDVTELATTTTTAPTTTTTTTAPTTTTTAPPTTTTAAPTTTTSAAPTTTTTDGSCAWEYGGVVEEEPMECLSVQNVTVAGTTQEDWLLLATIAGVVTGLWLFTTLLRRRGEESR